jgi:hypothetical protein
MPAERNLSNVNVGTTANDGTGDLLRDAFIKVNTNANALYNNGQFISFSADSRLVPGFTWFGDRDTGMYRPQSGEIGFALNGVQSLLLKNSGEITWYGDKIATEEYVVTELQKFTGGLASGNIVVNLGNVSGNTNVAVQVNGIPVFASLPTLGNYEGRLAFYNGDVWIYSSYPAGNGAGQAANPDIAREAGSDSRWVRFRGDSTISIGTRIPTSGVEGQQFYETANAKLYFYAQGAWKDTSAVIAQDLPTGIEVLTTLPLVSNPANFEGRTILQTSNNKVYLYRSGNWNLLSSYLDITGSGAGISAGNTFPLVGVSKVGELFRKEGSGEGLYVFDGFNWVTITAYVSDGASLRIPFYSSFPSGDTLSPGTLVYVSNVLYVLNETKTAWNLFTANGTVNIQLQGNSVTNSQLANGSVTALKIVSNVITGDKLVSNTITTRELSDLSVTAVKIAANAVTSTKIAHSSIGAEHLTDGCVTSNNIADGSITASKLSGTAFTPQNISTPNVSSLSTDLGIITSGVLRSSDGKMLVDLNSKIIRIEI